MAEKSRTDKPKQDTEAENEDATVIKELLSVASHERKNLQLLVEYFEKKIPELDERKQFFDRVSSQVPASLQKLDFVSQQIEEIKTFDVRVRDFQRVVKDIESNHVFFKEYKTNIDKFLTNDENDKFISIKDALVYKNKIF